MASALVMLTASLVGCGSASEGAPVIITAPEREEGAPEPGTAPNDDSTVTIGGTDDPETGSETPADPETTAPSTAPPTEWAGTVPFTNFAPYGPDSCRLSTRFENIKLNLTLRDDKVAAATLSAKDVEKLLGCTQSPKPTPRTPANHVWTYAPQGATTSTFTAKSAEGDLLPTELTVDVGLDSDSKGWASIRWKRTDTAAPFDFSVGPQFVALTRD